jgi:hypothetical protein
LGRLAVSGHRRSSDLTAVRPQLGRAGDGYNAHLFQDSLSTPHGGINQNDTIIVIPGTLRRLTAHIGDLNALPTIDGEPETGRPERFPDMIVDLDGINF